MTQIYLEGAILISIYMVVWFFICQWQKDNSLVDVAWGLGFVTVVWWMYFAHYAYQNMVLVIMVTLWGLRLAVYLLVRNLKKGEDWRYREMKQNWGRRQAVNAFFKVFLLQGGFMWIICLPLFQPTFVKEPMLQSIGGLFWLIGFLWEAIADWQLYRFKQSEGNTGKIMTAGLWQFSRHPNYFGEIVLWWGIFLYVIPYSSSWLILLSPITITWLLMRVSGVPLLEKKYKNNPDYREYVQRTNALFPNFFTKKTNS